MSGKNNKLRFCYKRASEV